MAAGVVIVLAAGIIGAHAGLTQAGQWQADEYFNFSLLRQLGGAFLRDRLLHWSPRPVSEALLAVYAHEVERLHRPLIQPFLLVCWAMPAVAALVGWGRGVMVPLALFALLLAGHPVDEMFYWPMGAAPYLACLAGVVFVSLRLVQGGAVSRAGRAAAACALVFAAGSAELGMLVVACLCPLLMVLEPPGAGRGARVAGWGVPLVVTVGLLVLLVEGRVRKLADPGAAGPLYHHFGASLLAAWRPFVTALGGGGGWAGAASAGLAFGGFACCLAGRRVAAPGRLLALAAALLGTAFVSIVAADDQFGRLCCERHASFRAGLVLLGWLALAGLVGGVMRPVAGWSGPALLGAAMLVLLPDRGPDLAHDYRRLAASVAAREASWRSGQGAGAAMTLSLPPKGRVVALGGWIAPGVYVAGLRAPWFATGVLEFFGKRGVRVTAGAS